MWKLFATVLAVSDNGSVATSAFVTDYPTEQGCQLTAADLMKSSSFEHVVNGRKIVFSTKALCQQVLFPPSEQRKQVQITPRFMLSSPFFDVR